MSVLGRFDLYRTDLKPFTSTLLFHLDLLAFKVTMNTHSDGSGTTKGDEEACYKKGTQPHLK